MIIYQVLLIAIPIFILSFYFYNLYNKRKQRQCAYGDARAFDILKTPGNYLPLKKVFETLDNPSERYFYSVSISRNMSLQALEDWANNEPDSPDALLCLGSRLLQWSWEARGYGRGKSISVKSWEEFYKRLERTRDVLLQCAEKYPEDPTPWSYLIMVATWSSDEEQVKYDYFNHAIERDAENWSAHMHMITGLSEKWGGSHEKMLQFAQEASQKASEGSDLAAILVKAYLEYWKYMDMFEYDEKSASEFIKRSDVRDEIIKVYNKSLLHKSHEDTKITIFVRYNFSGWFWITRDKPRLKHELSILGDTIENIHWRWVGTEGELQEARSFANES